MKRIISKAKSSLRSPQVISLLLVFVMTAALISVPFGAISQTDFNNKLSSLRNQYPNYSTWGGSFDGGSQCVGFARLMGYSVFGTKVTGWSTSTSLSGVKAGDVLLYGNTSGSGHTVFVTAVTGNTITFVDCNGNGNYTNGKKVRSCGIKWDNTIAVGAQMFGKYSLTKRYIAPGSVIIPDPTDPPVVPTEPAQTPNLPIGVTDVCEGISGAVHVRGWAFDPLNTSHTVFVHVYIGGKVGDPNAEGHAIVANLGGREDVDNTYHCGSNHAFYEDIATNKRGRQEVHVYALNADCTKSVPIGDYTVDILAPEEIGIRQLPNDYCNNHLETVEVIDGNKLHVVGWAFAKATPADYSLIDVYIGGMCGSDDVAEAQRCLASVQRNDVYEAFKSEYGNLTAQHGFDSTFTINARGTFTLYFYAVDQTGKVPVNPEFARAFNVTFTDSGEPEPVVPVVPETQAPTTAPTVVPTAAPTTAPTAPPAEQPTAAVQDIPYEDGEPYFEVADARAMAGDEFSVDVAIRNNPGITSFSVQLEFPDILTLTSVDYKNLFSTLPTGSKRLQSPFTVSWYSPGSVDEDKNGVFATLHFKAADDAAVGEYPISLSYDEDNVFDISFTNVKFGTKHGTLAIHDHIPGDVNNDGKVNMKDVVLLQQKINGWDVEVNEAFANVNGDDKVNMKDIVLLQQFINGWEVELK